jgi:hypothetical protein
MSFTLSVPHEHHEKITQALAEMPHVSLSEDKQSGVITNQSNGGTVSFAIKPNGKIEFTVIDGKGLSEDAIKKEIQGQAKQMTDILDAQRK